jgi:hypothetical protein
MTTVGLESAAVRAGYEVVYSSTVSKAKCNFV